MKANWREVRFGDLGKIVTGRTPPTEHREYFGDEYPFITPSDMGELKKASRTERYLSAAGASLLQRNLLPPGSVAVSCIGWQMGKVTMTSRPSFTNQQLNAIVPHDGVDPDFLYYALLPWRQYFLSLGAATGVRTPILNKSAFSDFRLTLPPLPTQRKIAAILSAYDDLIAVNIRRIALLEEMARGLYREWFVRFRFSGHERVRMVESAVGAVPEGWEVARLGDACAIVMGQSPSSEFYNESGQGLPFHQGVTDFGHLFPKDRVFCTVENRLANDGDILFSVRAPVGRINIANKKIVIGRGLSAIRNKAGHQAFVYFQLKHIFQEEDIMGGGTIFKAVTKDDVHGIKLLWPPESLIADFEQVANPILSSLGNLTAKYANLRRTRDLLLPRLVAGEVDVGELGDSVGGNA